MARLAQEFHLEQRISFQQGYDRRERKKPGKALTLNIKTSNVDVIPWYEPKDENRIEEKAQRMGVGGESKENNGLSTCSQY